jgi:hypothetical protein
VTSRTAAIVATVAASVAVLGLLIMLVLRPEPGGGSENAAASGAPSPTAGPSRTITARLLYVSEDGLQLTSVEREVPFAEGADQAREIINAQIAPPAPPLVSAVPSGTTLRALFITERGDAYVDLSREMVTGHPGGTLNELLTVYTIVDALTINMPAIRGVQILIDGREVQTLAGHVDLRQPLAANQGLVQ